VVRNDQNHVTNAAVKIIMRHTQDMVGNGDVTVVELI
jgi:hypothetical protein